MQDGCICQSFKLLDESMEIEMFCQDGDEVKKGDLMAKVTGGHSSPSVRGKVALNYLQRNGRHCNLYRSVVKLLEGSGVTFARHTQNHTDCRF